MIQLKIHLQVVIAMYLLLVLKMKDIQSLENYVECGDSFRGVTNTFELKSWCLKS